MKKYGRIVLILNLIYLNFLIAAGPGSTTAGFLKIIPDARFSALGNAGTICVNDINGTYWNPAGLSLLKGFSASFSHTLWFQDITFEYFSIGFPLKRAGTIALSLGYLGVPDIMTYTEAGIETGKKSVNNYDVIFSYGLKFGERFSAGLNLKYIYQSYIDVNGTGIGFDFGIIIFLPHNFKLGGAVQNLGPGIKFRSDSEAEKLPQIYKAGISYTIESIKPILFFTKINLLGEVNFPSDYDTTYHIGIEGVMGKLGRFFEAVIRAGYKYPEDINGANFTAGFGLKWRKLGFDFSYNSAGDIDKILRFTVQILPERAGAKHKEFQTSGISGPEKKTSETEKLKLLQQKLKKLKEKTKETDEGKISAPSQSESFPQTEISPEESSTTSNTNKMDYRLKLLKEKLKRLKSSTTNN